MPPAGLRVPAAPRAIPLGEVLPRCFRCRTLRTLRLTEAPFLPLHSPRLVHRIPDLFQSSSPPRDIANGRLSHSFVFPARAHTQARVNHSFQTRATTLLCVRLPVAPCTCLQFTLEVTLSAPLVTESSLLQIAPDRSALPQRFRLSLHGIPWSRPSFSSSILQLVLVTLLCNRYATLSPGRPREAHSSQQRRRLNLSSALLPGLYTTHHHAVTNFHSRPGGRPPRLVGPRGPGRRAGHHRLLSHERNMPAQSRSRHGAQHLL